jgi:helix-turn-helix protein
LTPRLDLPARDVVRRYREGESIKALMQRYGCSSAPIIRVLDEAGVERRPAHRPSGSTGKESPKSTARRREGQLRRRKRALLNQKIKHYCPTCGCSFEALAHVVIRHARKCRRVVAA